MDADRMTLALRDALLITYSHEAGRRWYTERRRRYRSTPDPMHNVGVLARLGIPEGGRPKIH